MGGAPNSAEIHYLTVAPGSHNAEVEGSSPPLTTKINELPLLDLGIFYADVERCVPSSPPLVCCDRVAQRGYT
jgi:hypothetical protein